MILRFLARRLALAEAFDTMPSDQFVQLLNSADSWLRVHVRTRAYQWAAAILVASFAVILPVGIYTDPGVVALSALVATPPILSVLAFHATQWFHMVLLLEAVISRRGD
jgi:hypothetical protein